MLKIVTLPFNERTEEFEQGKLERILGNVQIVKYQAELVKIEGKYYWTAFVEYEKAENIDKNLEKNNFLQNGKYIKEVNKNHEEYLSEEEAELYKILKEWRSGSAKLPILKLPYYANSRGITTICTELSTLARILPKQKSTSARRSN